MLDYCVLLLIGRSNKGSYSNTFDQSLARLLFMKRSLIEHNFI